MQTLVTGATGLIGHAIARKLKQKGLAVRALVRDLSRAKRLLPAGVEPAQGDVTEPGSLGAAMRGVDWVFHAAGMPEQWQRDDGIFDRVNRGGTANVLGAAHEAGVRRVVYTSTMDVFEAPRGGTLVETRLNPRPLSTAYERSKQAAEAEAEKVRARGLDVVYINPAAAYGPSPVHVAMNSFFIQLLHRKVPLLPPGGASLAFVEGVADAHIAAAERGRPGERYLVADEHVSMRTLAQEIIHQAASGQRVPAVMPEALAKAIAYASAPLARLFGFEPLLAPGPLTFLLWDVRVNTEKAQRELGFTPTRLDDGVRQTIDFLRNERLVPTP